MFKYLLYKFGQFWVNLLPLRVAYKIAMFVSDLHYYFSFRDRRAVQNNLRVICPEGSDIKALSRQVFRNFGKYLVEFFRMVTEIDDNFLKTRVVTKNLHRLDDALKKGKGVILLTAHIGNWELGGVLLSQLGYPSIAIALPHKERPVNNLFNRQRESRGVKIVPVNVATRKCLLSLRENKIVAVVADRSFGASSLTLDFLGRRANFPKGPAIFSLKTGAPILPLFLVRARGDQFELIAEEPVYPPSLGGQPVTDDVLERLMRRYIVAIEEKIRQYPDQWLMFRDFSAQENFSAALSAEGQNS